MVNTHLIALSHGELSPHRSFSHCELPSHRCFSVVNFHPTVLSHGELSPYSSFILFIFLFCLLSFVLFVCFCSSLFFIIFFFFVTPSEVRFDTVSQLLFCFGKLSPLGFYSKWQRNTYQWHASAPSIYCTRLNNNLHPSNQTANKSTRPSC